MPQKGNDRGKLDHFIQQIGMKPRNAEFDDEHNLTELDLVGLNLTSLPPEIGQFSHLQVLILSNNALASVPPEINYLTNLRQLWLNQNNLTSILPEISYLTNLEYLILSHNKLTFVPSELSHLNNLEFLDLSENPIRTPPPEIVIRGADAVLDFLRELAKGSVNRYEAKILILGESGVGKTCLLDALQGKPFLEERTTTHRIAVTPYQLPHPDKPEQTLTFNVWDFDAAQISHSTYQLFMTKRSLYLLVWDTRSYPEQARPDSWLRKIQMLVPNAPVLLVTTHIEEHPADLDYDRFKAVYPQLAGHIGVSSKENIGIEKLKKMIAREAVKLPVMEQQWPKTWVAVETALQENPNSYINLDEYTNICVQQGVSEEVAQTVLGGYLHDLGKILYYQDDDTLSNVIVLKPNWLTQAISRVLDTDLTYHNSGILAHTDLLAIWDKDEDGNPYKHVLYPCFLQLLSRFQMIYELESPVPTGKVTHSLVPFLLPHNPPEDMPAWQVVLPDQPEIKMVFRLSNLVLPEIMNRIIVHTYLYTKGVHWRKGVHLSYEGHEARIELYSEFYELWVQVKGPTPGIFFTILQHIINDRILQRCFEGTEYTREIPCNCHIQRDDIEACPYFYDYESLIEHLKHRKFSVECGISFENVSVFELLLGFRDTTNALVASELQEIQETLRQTVRDTPGDQQITKALGRINQNLNRFMNILLSRLNTRETLDKKRK
jgi:GTPase SAR1 family protein